MRVLIFILRGALVTAMVWLGISALLLFVRPEFSRQYNQSRLAFQYDASLLATCLTVSWQTQGVTELLLDEQPVALTGSKALCPGSKLGPQFEAVFEDGTTRPYNRGTLGNAFGTQFIFLVLAVSVLLLTFRLPSRLAIVGAVATVSGIGAWIVAGLPNLPVLEMRQNVLTGIPLMNQVFIIALLIPFLYWRTPARWRMTLLLIVSSLTLLYGGVTFEYVALLALLLSLTWVVVSPIPDETAQLIPSWGLRVELLCLVILAVGLALGQRVPVGSVSNLLMGAAGFMALSAAAAIVVAEMGLGARLWRRLIPLALVGVLSLAFTSNLDLILTRFESVEVLLGLLMSVTLLMCSLCLRWGRRATAQQRRVIAGVGIGLLILLFIIFKWPSDAAPLAWFGFSYIAFRLLHVLLERRLNAPLPTATPETWGVYTLFFSAQAVGPIDRWPRFAGDVQAEKTFSWEDFVAGWERILWGAIKKFFIADVLLRPLIPGDVALAALPTVYAWVQLYAYAFYLYCDFSGFVDIAIGTARLLGFHLPENFDRPYTRGSLAQFWQSWHITLSGWLRTYVFLPLSRSLLRTRLRRFSLLTVLLANVVTMSLIGLWHGFTGNFLAWGLWHALGLFVHKVFADRTRRTQLKWKNTWRAQAFHGVSVFLTFHFVVMGWVFFALPTLPESVSYLLLLWGIR